MSVERLSGPVLSAFRMVVGLLFLSHGLASLFGWFGGNPATGGALETGAWPGWWAAVIQLVCGLLVLVGVAERPAAVLASGSMAYAYFVVHQESGLLPLQNGGEAAALFCWSMLLIAALGGGPYRVGALFDRTPAETAAEETAAEETAAA